MSITKFNSEDGYSIADPPIALIDNIGNYTTTTGNINAVEGNYTGIVTAPYFLGGNMLFSGSPASITGPIININDNTNTTTIGPITTNSTYMSIDGTLGFINLSEFVGGGINLDSSTTINIGDISGLGGTGEFITVDPQSYVASFNGLTILTTNSVQSPVYNYVYSATNAIIASTLCSSTTTTSTTQFTLVSLVKATYRSVKFIIQAVNTTGSKYQITEINAIHNGNTTVASATINDTNTGGSNATYVVDINGTTLRLRATPTSTQSTVFKVLYTSLL